MGNIVPGIVVLLLFSGIITYLVRSLKTKGTICASCDSCILASKCNKEEVTNDLRQLIKNQKIAS